VALFSHLRYFEPGVISDPQSSPDGQTQQVQTLDGNVLGEVAWGDGEPSVLESFDRLGRHENVPLGARPSHEGVKRIRSQVNRARRHE